MCVHDAQRSQAVILAGETAIVIINIVQKSDLPSSVYVHNPNDRKHFGEFIRVLISGS